MPSTNERMRLLDAKSSALLGDSERTIGHLSDALVGLAALLRGVLTMDVQLHRDQVQLDAGDAIVELAGALSVLDIDFDDLLEMSLTQREYQFEKGSRPSPPTGIPFLK